MPGVQSSLSAIDHKVVDVELNVARRSIAHHNVALAGATIVTSRGDEVIDSGTIVIVNGRIEQIGSSDCVRVPVRSEEHTSELQSLMRISYAVFCLKKKKKILII